MDYRNELVAAQRAVAASEATFRRYFGTRTDVRRKRGNPRDIVSYADKKIEHDIRGFLLKRFPHHGFVGEEGDDVRAHARFVWAIDPIDGTSNYVQGEKACAICVGLLDRSRPCVGVVAAPMAGEWFAARRAGGATLNGKRIAVVKKRGIEGAFTAFGWGHDRVLGRWMFGKLLGRVYKLRVVGSAALSLCYVARGTYDAAVLKDMKIWDYAAAEVIVRESGGVLLPVGRSDILVAANKPLAKRFCSFLKTPS